VAKDREDQVGTVGVVLFSQPGYPEDVLASLSRRATDAVAESGASVAGGSLIRQPEDVEPAVRSLRRHRLDALVVVVLSWAEPPNALRVVGAFPGVPVFLWAVQGFRIAGQRVSTGGLIGAAAVKPLLADRHPPIVFEWGLPEEELLRAALRRFVRVSRTVAQLRTARAGLVGYASMGSYGATVDPGLAYRRLGVEICHIETLSVVNRLRSLGTRSLPEPLQALLEYGPDVGPAERERLGRFYLALREIATEKACDALTIKCHRELSEEEGLTACVPLSLLAAELTVSCEGDMPLLLTQLALRYLTGSPTAFVDIYEIEGDRVLIGTCGFIPAFWAVGERLRLTRWGEGYARGVVVSNPVREGLLTLARLQPGPNGDFVLHATAGTSVGLAEKWGELGCPAFPGGEVALDGSGYRFGQGLQGPHYAVAPGDVRAELRLLGHLLSVSVDIVTSDVR